MIHILLKETCIFYKCKLKHIHLYYFASSVLKKRKTVKTSFLIINTLFIHFVSIVLFSLLLLPRWDLNETDSI